MPNILLTRIDNRLIHGQVVIHWTHHLGANVIVVANDDVSKNKMRQHLMNMAKPNGVDVKYWSIQQTADNIETLESNKKVFIVCSTPQDVLSLVEKGTPIKKINIGNMHMSEGKKQVATVVSVDDDDISAFKKLRDNGVELEIRRVPGDCVENIEKIFE